MHRFEVDSRPWVRWWWLRGPFLECDIKYQLTWLRDNGFGGVELAWLCPLWEGLDPVAAVLPRWLGKEFSELLAVTKHWCDELQLGCDFTFGSAWPFGGTCVRREDASSDLDGHRKTGPRGSWEEPACGYVIDHLSSAALRGYAKCMLPAFADGLTGSTSALFCDSWEIRKDRLWSDHLWAEFSSRFGYDLRDFTSTLRGEPQVRYDHRKLVGETVVREFYAAFTRICHELGAQSRVQCHGSPTDLISAYAEVDIPESEAMLFNPHFSRIPGSAAALANKRVVSCETFTCIYGFPSPGNTKPSLHWRREQVADLKLLADSLFAQGVNQIIWHGMPYTPQSNPHKIEFYASVHVAPGCGFEHELVEFNGYLERTSNILKQGRTLSRLAVYLPYEDQILRGNLESELRVPGSQDHAEMRYVTLPEETEGYAPLWISSPFLKQSTVVDGVLCYGQQRFQALYVDAEWLDYETLEAIVVLAENGLPVVVKRRSHQPGYLPQPGYEGLVSRLSSLEAKDLSQVAVRPFLKGGKLPWFWVRGDQSTTWMFLAHPQARELMYPMNYGQSFSSREERICLEIDTGSGVGKRVEFSFAPYTSLMIKIQGADVSFVDLDYVPPTPSTTSSPNGRWQYL